MSAMTPGRAFRETLHERWAARGHPVDTRPWEALPEIDREDLDAAAKAAVPALAGLLETARQLRDEAMGEAMDLRALVAEILAHLRDAGIVIDPELLAAWREREAAIRGAVPDAPGSAGTPGSERAREAAAAVTGHCERPDCACRGGTPG